MFDLLNANVFVDRFHEIFFDWLFLILTSPAEECAQ